MIFLKLVWPVNEYLMLMGLKLIIDNASGLKTQLMKDSLVLCDLVKWTCCEDPIWT